MQLSRSYRPSIEDRSILWTNNLTEAQAKGLEQKIISHFGGAQRHNSTKQLSSKYRSYSPYDSFAPKHDRAASEESWQETLRRIGGAQ